MIVVDVETTGLSPQRNALVSIGAVDFAEPTRQFYGECRPRAGAQIDDGALAVNGYSREQLHDPERPSAGQLLQDFIAWLEPIRDTTIAGQNPSFDRGFLSAEAKQAGINWWPSHRLIDLHSLAFAALLRADLPMPVDERGRSSLSSDRIMELVGVPTEPRPHIAINGALWEAEAFGRLIYGRNFLPQFAEYSVPAHLLERSI
jgi:DNA polymerase-3 subunit epsilon